jgi:heavy metal sensor kinase
MRPHSRVPSDSRSESHASAGSSGRVATRHWHRRTLRTDLTLSYAGLLALFLAALGLTYYHVFARQLDLDATAELAEITRGVHGYIRFQDGMPILEYDRDDPDQVAFVQDATRYYQVYDGNSGRLLVQSAALEPLGLHYTPGEVRAFLERPVVADVQTDRRRIRFSNSVISPARGETYLVQLGIPLDGRDAALRRLEMLLSWGLPVGLLTVLAVGRWMAGRVLVPLARLAAAARTIRVTDLHRRLPMRGVDDELDEVADAFNGVVAHLERAVGDMKQFSAAMAHEIRTPLAAIRADMELSLSGRRSVDEHRQAVAGQLEEIDKLAGLVGQLLTLARAEAGELSVKHEPVQVADLCRAIVESMEPVAQAKDIALTCECSEPVEMVGDAGWIERLVLNLVDNALKFTAPGGTVTVSATQQHRAVTLAVRDTGVGIRAGALPHVFDRFYRADSARSRSQDGAGLGLSLVKWIVERHEGTIEVASTPGRGTTFTVTLPMIGRVMAA